MCKVFVDCINRNFSWAMPHYLPLVYPHPYVLAPRWWCIEAEFAHSSLSFQHFPQSLMVPCVRNPKYLAIMFSRATEYHCTADKVLV